MKSYNPKKKSFVYGMDMAGPAAATRLQGRTPISSDSWFELHAVSIIQTGLTLAQLDQVYLQIYDDATGRTLFSEPISANAIFPVYDLNAAGGVWFPLVHKPFYFPVQYLFRPGAVLRIEVDNRNAAAAATAFRVYYHGVKVFDLASRDQSPGAVFAPFSYVANFGTLANLATGTVAVATQSDADFEFISMTTNDLNFDATIADADQAFITFQDLTTGYQLQDRAIALPCFIGTPLAPYYPVRPYRIMAAGGLSVQILNTSGAGLADLQVVFNGYKIFR
jgi:hypothetical protein